MKFFVAFAAFVAVAVAGPVVRPIVIGPAIIDDFKPEPIAIGPAIIDDPMDNIVIGPAIIDHPLDNIAIGPAIIDHPEDTYYPSPAPPVAPSSAPLVQLIVNVNAGASPVAPGPVSEPAPIGAWEVPEGHEDDKPWPIQIVDSAPEHDDDEPWPINIVESAPEVAPVEPVIIGTPVIPAPAVTLPEIIN